MAAKPISTRHTLTKAGATLFREATGADFTQVVAATRADAIAHVKQAYGVDLTSRHFKGG